jgi:hypothetical protein
VTGSRQEGANPVGGFWPKKTKKDERREAVQALGMTKRELDQYSEAFEHPEREAAGRAATRVFGIDETGWRRDGRTSS